MFSSLSITNITSDDDKFRMQHVYRVFKELKFVVNSYQCVQNT